MQSFYANVYFSGSVKTETVAKTNKGFFMKFLLMGLNVYSPVISVSWLLIQWTLGCHSFVTVGYFTISECREFPVPKPKWSTRSTIQFLVVASIQSWLCLDVCGTACIVWAFTMVQAYCQWRYLKMAKHLILDKSGHSMNNLALLRQLQVLNRYYNLVQQGSILPITIFMTVFSIVLGYYVLISLGSHISTPELLLFYTCANDGLVVLLVLTTVMSWIYAESGKNIQFVMKAVLFPNICIAKERKLAQRYVRSFPPLKCYIGNCNFIEELTPLNLLSFSANQTASLILLNK